MELYNSVKVVLYLLDGYIFMPVAFFVLWEYYKNWIVDSGLHETELDEFCCLKVGLFC